MGAADAYGFAVGVDGNLAGASGRAGSGGSGGVSRRAGVLPDDLSVDEAGAGHGDGLDAGAKDSVGAHRVADPDGVCRRHRAGAVEYQGGSRGYEGSRATGSLRVCDLPGAVDSEHAPLGEFSGSRQLSSGRVLGRAADIFCDGAICVAGAVRAAEGTANPDFVDAVAGWKVA